MWAGLGYYRRARFLLEVRLMPLFSSPFLALFLLPPFDTVMQNLFSNFNELIYFCPTNSRNMFSMHLQV